MKFVRLIGFVLLLPLLMGCGSSNSVTIPTITRVGTGINTLPTTLNALGGTATVLVDITDVVGVNTNSVKMDVVKQNGTISLLGGAQAMTSLSSVQNRWGYQVTLPPNASTITDDVYTVTVTAASVSGGAVSPPYVVGTVTVPHL
jgi:hypothetical protein